MLCFLQCYFIKNIWTCVILLIFLIYCVNFTKENSKSFLNSEEKKLKKDFWHCYIFLIFLNFIFLYLFILKLILMVCFNELPVRFSRVQNKYHSTHAWFCPILFGSFVSQEIKTRGIIIDKWKKNQSFKKKKKKTKSYRERKRRKIDRQRHREEK